MIRIFDPISDFSKETHPFLLVVSELTSGLGLNFSWILTDLARAVCLTLFEFYGANNWGV